MEGSKRKVAPAEHAHSMQLVRRSHLRSPVQRVCAVTLVHAAGLHLHLAVLPRGRTRHLQPTHTVQESHSALSGEGRGRCALGQQRTERRGQRTVRFGAAAHCARHVRGMACHLYGSPADAAPITHAITRQQLDSTRRLSHHPAQWQRPGSEVCHLPVGYARGDHQVKRRARQHSGGRAKAHVQLVEPRFAYRVVHRVHAHYAALGVEGARVDAPKCEGHSLLARRELVRKAGPGRVARLLVPAGAVHEASGARREAGTTAAVEAGIAQACCADTTEVSPVSSTCP